MIELEDVREAARACAGHTELCEVETLCAAVICLADRIEALEKRVATLGARTVHLEVFGGGYR